MSGDVFAPSISSWHGDGLSGNIEQEPVLLITREIEWSLVDEEMTRDVRGAFARFHASLMFYGRSIKALQRALLACYPDQMSDPTAVRSPAVAKDAVTVSILYWLLQSRKRYQSYSDFVDGKVESTENGKVTVRLNAWAFEVKEKGALGERKGRELIQKLHECSETVSSSIEATKFKGSYEAALKATDELRRDLLVMSK